jgi:hypothetical protein
VGELTTEQKELKKIAQELHRKDLKEQAKKPSYNNG